MRRTEILDFIQRRWQVDANWLTGNCYWFAYILTTRFPELEIYYLAAIGHFIAGDGEHFYDWTGEIEPTADLWKLTTIQEIEPNWYQRLVRDCIL